jgi:ABC-type glycerol-3-phosphate transport system substrate-binding protein
MMNRLGTMTSCAVAAAAALATYVACAAPPHGTATTAVSASAAAAESPAVVHAVQAYLRTFKLNEKELAENLTIPYTRYQPGVAIVGAARVTGTTGPQGHQVYEVFAVFGTEGSSTGGGLHEFVEIAPE